MATWKEVFPDKTNIIAGIMGLIIVLFIALGPLYVIVRDLSN